MRTPGINFTVSHPSSNCSTPSTLNGEVPCGWASRKRKEFLVDMSSLLFLLSQDVTYTPHSKEPMSSSAQQDRPLLAHVYVHQCQHPYVPMSCATTGHTRHVHVYATDRTGPCNREGRLLEIRHAIEHDEERNQTQGHKDLTWKTSPTRRGKNHGRQPANLHYIGGGYKRRGFTTDQLIPCGGLQRIYITQVT